ncbi:formate transporter FocA [Photobacterium sanguinicancri]|uniref:Formate transporter FocA n=1 Tax=Photobacterium sanguinicancri TaxID=875932 RepID=A0AAW7YB29_9GAMM|nr:formate transporter FocA [Photobacterium sanguinicancri]MDO6545210.1 formate transporter FocA [Photobacterium sanguinicancri]
MSNEQNPFDALMPTDMTIKAEEVGIYKATKNPLQSFVLAITAGVFISIAFVFYITVTTGSGDMAWGMAKFVGAIAFSLGLILVVICGGELFTSTVLTTVARASNRITTRQLIRNWVTVYFGNMLGALFFVALIWLAKQHLGNSGEWGIHAMQVAQHKIHHTFIQAVVLGILCNLMVCLAVWMTFSCHSATDKVMVMILPVAMFVACGFEHSIANMFMIPMGIVIQSFASPEFWLQTGHTAAEFADLNVANMVLNNLIPVTIGNIIGGGFFVGLTYWAIHRRPQLEKQRAEQAVIPK